MESDLYPEISPCPSVESCELIQDFLNKKLLDLEKDERIQIYGIDYNILDLLCMKDNPWESLRRLI